MKLGTQSRFAHPDAAYELLVDAHRDLGAPESRALDARLVLILANHTSAQALFRGSG